MEHTGRSSLYTVEGESPETEIKIKGSRFIGQTWRIGSVEEFNSIYDRVQKKHVHASHHCYAYRLSRDLYHYYDDGEPSGTAGKPIFHILQEQDLIGVLITVVRYFGGTLLGKGGLVKAYSRSAQEALKNSRRIPRIVYREIAVRVRYPSVPELTSRVRQYGGTIEQTEFSEQVGMILRLAEDQQGGFEEELQRMIHKDQLIVVAPWRGV